MLPHWHTKDLSHSARSAGGKLHLTTHTPSTQQSQTRLTMLLSRHSVGTYQKTSSHVTRQGTLGHSRLSSLSHCGLILALRLELVCASQAPLKKKKKAQAGNEWSNILSKSSHSRKKRPPIKVMIVAMGWFQRDY